MFKVLHLYVISTRIKLFKKVQNQGRERWREERRKKRKRKEGRKKVQERERKGDKMRRNSGASFEGERYKGSDSFILTGELVEYS